MKVLLVDDNEIVLRVLARILRHLGHTVETASSYHEGLQRLRELAPEALVTDLELGDGFGTDLIRRARSEHLATRCVLVTANTEFVLPDDLAEAHLLAKPCRTEDLAAVLGPPAVAEPVVAYALSHTPEREAFFELSRD